MYLAHKKSLEKNIYYKPRLGIRAKGIERKERGKKDLPFSRVFFSPWFLKEPLSPRVLYGHAKISNLA